MISKRLTKIQKNEILEAYRCGENTNSLAEKYNCSSNTINRTVKMLLSDIEYKKLKAERSSSSNKKVESISNKTGYGGNPDIDIKNSFNTIQSNIQKSDQALQVEDDLSTFDFNEIDLLPIESISSAELQNIDDNCIDKNNQDSDNKFEEIVPLIPCVDFEEKPLEFEIYSQEILPEIVYMLVDKKVELDVKSISDFPEWSFLPENELKRNAIVLFLNQRNAKRSCSKNQRVIKIPNTSVFKVSKSYLISKGITRLILEDSIIALDN